MMKVVDDTQDVMVDFVNDSTRCMAGQLLIYEISGEACVLLEGEKIWIPFSNLTQASQVLIMEKGIKIKNQTNINMLKDPKAGVILTLLVMVFYCFVQVSL